MIIEPGLLTVIQYVGIGVGLINVALLLGLFYIYWNSYNKIRSEFTLGLIFFALVLLAQNVFETTCLVLLSVSGIYNHELIAHSLELSAINIIQFVALSILFKITW